MELKDDASTNLLSILGLIFRSWRWPKGLLLAIFLELCLIFFFEILNLSLLSKVSLFMLSAMITSLIWVVSNKRAFQKTGYWIFLWFSIVIGIICLFPTFVYNNYIINSSWDLPFIRFWGTTVVALCLFSGYYIVDFKIVHRNKLCIVFLISNYSKYENKIRQTLENARYKIESEVANINIVIPPFGIADDVKKCDFFINNLFCQADAVIYTRIIDSNDEFGYKLTNFTSRMNSRHMSQKVDDIDHCHILSEASKCKDWNTLNKEGNSIAKKGIMANDLYQLLLIYVGCIYLYKRMYSDALPIADKLFRHSGEDGSRLNDLTNALLADAYLTAAQWEEQENQDYNKALNNLHDCVVRLPYISTTLRYKLAMARNMLLLGNIKESKKMTKSVTPSSSTRNAVNGYIRDPHMYDWYVNINLAFYAIYERRPLEVISNYKRLFKSPSPNKKEIEFAINFLQNQYKTTYDDQYRMFLLHGIAFLSLYIDKKKSMSFLERAESYKEMQGYSQLLKLRNLITEYNGNLRIRK